MLKMKSGLRWARRIQALQVETAKAVADAWKYFIQNRYAVSELCELLIVGGAFEEHCSDRFKRNQRRLRV
jgi:hypothetical protein